MLEQKTNQVFVEGILSEKNLKLGTYDRKGVPTDAISGTVTILVDEETKTGNVVSEIPVNVFSYKTTNDGRPNVVYENLMDVLNNFKSISEVGTDAADKIRVSGKTNGRLTMNEYYNSKDKLNAIPRVTASFLNKSSELKYRPHANFVADLFVVGFERAVDEDGVELDPPVLNVRGVLPRYGGDVDVITFVAKNPSVIDGIEHYWEANNTYRVDGRLEFTVTTEKKTQTEGFGEMREFLNTYHKNEIVITHGSEEPLDEEFGYSVADINDGINKRKARLAALKEKPTVNKTPSLNKDALDDLGF